MTDSNMPERIWAQPEHTDDPAYGGFWIKSKVAPSVAYIRADLAHHAPVADAELEALTARMGAIVQSPYALREALIHNCDLGQITMGDVADLITALRARPAVKVKALEWKAHNDKYDGGRTHYGTGIFGHWYCINRAQNGEWLLMHHVDGRPHHFSPVASLQDAKAAAQADYEQRILSALLPDGGA